MHSDVHLLRNTKVTVPKSSNISFDQIVAACMELDTKLGEIHAANQPVFLSENYIKPYMKNDIPFDVPSSKGTYLQEFDHHLDDHQFHVTGSSSYPVFGVQTPCFDSFDSFPYNYSSNFDLYECKPFADGNGGHGQVMDNFQSGGYLNNRQVNPVNMVGSNQARMPLDFQEMKPVNFAVPDEVSCVGADENGYYKKAGLNKNNRPYPPARRTIKIGKKSNVVKGQWTTEEDRLLIRLVEQYGIRKWSHIAQMLPGRIGKQCRERWHNHLRPDIKKDTWSEEEDKALIEAHAEIGNKWAEIAKRLPGRTENSIKNHWNATKRRQFSKRKCRSKYPRASLLQEYIKSLNLDSSSSKQQRKTSNNAAATAGNINNIKNKAQNQTPAEDFCPTDHLVPDFDFNEVPEFDFDDKLFEENCSIDSLIEEMPCAPVVDEKSLEMDVQLDVESEVKKELDLVEMISQANL